MKNAVVLALLLVACDAAPAPDAGVDASVEPDAGVDAAPPTDSGPARDGGGDAGASPDGGSDAGSDGGVPSSCAPQQALFDGACDTSHGVYWDGESCVERSGCACVGADCLERYATVAVCEADHVGCAPAPASCVPTSAAGGTACSAEVRYVTTDGSPSADGLTPETSWTLAHAFSQARANMTVFVRAGDYGAFRGTVEADGTAEQPIRFVGTDPDWNLVRPHARASVSGLAPLDASLTPLLSGEITDGRTNGTAVTVRGDHVEFDSFQATRYERGFEFQGSHPVLRNLVTDYLGDFTGSGGFTDYNGWGIIVSGANAVAERCFVRDAGAQGFTVQGRFGVYRDIEVVGTDTNNDMDYYFLFNGQDNHASNVHIYRTPGISHLGHGICLKPVGAVTERNVVDGFRIENTNVELQFAGCQHNTIRNGVVSREGAPEWSTAITVANGASQNLFENVLVRDGYAGVVFNDWDDGAGDEAAGDLADAGFDNTFVNLVVQNCQYSVFMRDQGSAGVAHDNRFIHSTFAGGNRLFRTRRANEGTRFDNCIFHDLDGFAQEDLGFTVSPSTVFETCNTSDSGFAAFDGYVANNITTVTPTFTGPNDYRPIDAALDLGSAAGLPEAATRDFHGRPRTTPTTLGAFERE